MTERTSITDVPGIRVGQVQRVGEGWLTGVRDVDSPPRLWGRCYSVRVGQEFRQMARQAEQQPSCDGGVLPSTTWLASSGVRNRFQEDIMQMTSTPKSAPCSREAHRLVRCAGVLKLMECCPGF